MMEKWIVYNKKADFKGIGQRYQIDPVTARVIRNRGLTEDEDIRLFLRGTMADTYDPHLLKDADRLVDILIDKIEQGRPIRILGDYDIDGVMASYILLTALKRCGADVSVQIPHRILDGYGINEHLVRLAEKEQVDTILTCDNGIAAIEEIALAKELGMTVLVTDHHEIPFEETKEGRRELQSRADAIVNPHQSACAYPNKNLCGAAVAWKIVCILYERMKLEKGEAEQFLENVAFATVGDVMSLTGENRILVREGLKRIHHTENTGMRALIAQCGLRPAEIKAYHFGYVLGPCINASGRLDTAKRSLELLVEEDESRALVCANELVQLNEERKLLTNEGVEEAKRIYESGEYEKDRVIVIFLANVHESVAGIIAGRIREYYHKPTFILTESPEGIKGSGRSTENYSMYEELCRCQELLTKFGGHPMAAGLSLSRENVEPLRRRLNENCSLSREDMIPRIYIDVPMPVDYVTPELVCELSVLEPFGKDNEQPVFADRDIRILHMWVCGKNRNVLSLTLQSAQGTRISGVLFGNLDAFFTFIREKFGESSLQAALSGQENGIRISMIYRPKIHCYRGEEQLQFEIRNYC